MTIYNNFFLFKYIFLNEFSAAITTVFSITRPFRNHSNMLIWCSGNIYYYCKCWKPLCCLILYYLLWGDTKHAFDCLIRIKHKSGETWICILETFPEYTRAFRHLFDTNLHFKYWRPKNILKGNVVNNNWHLWRWRYPRILFLVLCILVWRIQRSFMGNWWKHWWSF